jgi:hypothetical protein
MYCKICYGISVFWELSKPNHPLHASNLKNSIESTHPRITELQAAMLSGLHPLIAGSRIISGSIAIEPGRTPSSHFSPSFYCGGGSMYVCRIALPRGPRHTVQYALWDPSSRTLHPHPSAQPRDEIWREKRARYIQNSRIRTI